MSRLLQLGIRFLSAARRYVYHFLATQFEHINVLGELLPDIRSELFVTSRKGSIFETKQNF